MWEYYWGHTKAQVELLSVDAPFVAYKKRDKPKPGQPGYKSDPDKVQRDYEKWLERKKTRKVHLETFMGKKENKENTNINDRENGTK